MTGSFFIFSKHASFWGVFVLFFGVFFFLTLIMSQSLLEDILHKVTLTKIISNATSFWLSKSSFHFNLFDICTSYKHKLRGEGETSSFHFLN